MFALYFNHVFTGPASESCWSSLVEMVSLGKLIHENIDKTERKYTPLKVIRCLPLRQWPYSINPFNQSCTGI